MLTEKEQKIKAMYEKQLAIPKMKYIIVYGILLWGFTMLVMLTLVDRFVFNRPFDRETLIIRVIVMPFAGILFGVIMRSTSARRLARLNAKEAEADNGSR
jgi:hypothetical protein